MTTLPDALYKGITGHRTRTTEGRSTRSIVQEIERARGFHTPPGMSARTWQRLRKDPDKKVTAKTRKVLVDAQRRVRLSAAREAKLRKPRPGITMMAQVAVSSDDRVRKLKIGTWPDPQDPMEPQITGMLNEVLDKWLVGDDAGAATAFMAPVEANFRSNVIVSDVHWIRLGHGGQQP